MWQKELIVHEQRQGRIRTMTLSNTHISTGVGMLARKEKIDELTFNASSLLKVFPQPWQTLDVDLDVCSAWCRLKTVRANNAVQ